MWVGPGNYSLVIDTSLTNFTMPWGSATTLNYFMFGGNNSDIGYYYVPLEAPGEPITAIVQYNFVGLGLPSYMFYQF